MNKTNTTNYKEPALKEKSSSEKWEEEFEREFPNSRGVFENGDPYGSRRRAIKSFISSLLSQQKEKILEVVRGMKKTYGTEYYGGIKDPLNDPTGVDGYNSAPSDVEEKLKGL